MGGSRLPRRIWDAECGCRDLTVPRSSGGAHAQSGVRALAWGFGRVADCGLLPLCDLGERNHFCWSLAMKPFAVAFRNELRQGEFPGLLPMVGEPTEFLRIQTELTGHLDMQIAEVKPPLGVRPGVEARLRLLHNLSFSSQPLGQGLHDPKASCPLVGVVAYHPMWSRQRRVTPATHRRHAHPHRYASHVCTIRDGKGRRVYRRAACSCPPPQRCSRARGRPSPVVAVPSASTAT
jgi:hypothetical protein